MTSPPHVQRFDYGGALHEDARTNRCQANARGRQSEVVGGISSIPGTRNQFSHRQNHISGGATASGNIIFQTADILKMFQCHIAELAKKMHEDRFQDIAAANFPQDEFVFQD
jgi:hypothetical protein